jgi:hypothetical protein
MSTLVEPVVQEPEERGGEEEMMTSVPPTATPERPSSAVGSGQLASGGTRTTGIPIPRPLNRTSIVLTRYWYRMR